MKRFIFLTIIFFATPFVANGATEFISVIDPGNGSGTDYTSLSAWEAANQVDLTAATTLVIAGSLTRGTIADGVAITQTTTGATAVCVHHTTSQMLISTLVGTPDATSTWYPTVDGSDATNAWTPTDAGDSAIAIAKCRSTMGTADTTAVTIDGWTTSATNYIKVWTDPSENYRHQGKWDEGKYRLEVNGYNLYIREGFVRVDGLQINNIYSGAFWSAGIFLDMGSVENPADVRISNSILKYSGTATGYVKGIWSSSDSDVTNGVIRVWNNIFYDFTSGSSPAAITSEELDYTIYAYNNTIHNCSNGLVSSWGTFIAKNNIVKGSGDTNAYVGTFAVGTDYNATDGTDNIGQGSNNKISQTFIFADEANDDFHLDSADTAARNAGTILYDSGDDANLNFTTDVDNNSRLDSAGTWDIGADEVITKVYRSVGPSATTAIATGATYGNVEVKPAYLAGSTTTITDYVASFWSDLPTNVGVGDALQYDDDDDGDIDASDSIVFITKRIDASHFSVRTASGTAPASTLAPDSNWSIFRSYTSLFDAEAGTENTGIDADLVNFDTWSGGKNIQTSQEQWNISCYAGQGGVADMVALDTLSWATNIDSYLKIYTPTRSDEVGVTQRHSGVWDDTKYNLSTVTGNASLKISANYTVIDGLQVTNSGTASTDDVINIYGYRNYVTVRNSIIKGGNNGIMNSVQGTQYGGHKFYNNIVYNAYLGGIRIYLSGGAPVASYIYNNTVYNCNTSNTDWRGGIEAEESGIAKNNISMENGYYDFAVSAGQSYNISSDTSAAGTGSLVSQTLSDIDFVSTTAGSEDLHILPTSVAKNIGTDLSNDPYIPFNTDITSTCLRKDKQSRVTGGGDDLCYTRPRQGSGVAQWDIGAHELITKIYRSVAPDADGSMAAIDDDNSQADTLTIATSGTATFEVAVADIVGVGDALVWDDDDDNDLDADDTILFIHGRTDSTHYTVRTESGALPTAGTTDNDKWAIYRAYTSLFNAEAGTKNTAIPISFTGGNRDIATNSEQWNIACYANGTEADTTGVTINGWTTAAQNYIKVYTPYLTSEVGTSQRHQGKWDEGKYRMEANTATLLKNDDADVRIDGLQLHQTATATDWRGGIGNGEAGGPNAVADIRVSNNIIRSDNTSNINCSGIQMTGSVSGSIMTVWNNIIYGGFDKGIYLSDSDFKFYVYNNTVLGTNQIVNAYGIYANNMVAKNNIVSGYGNSVAYVNIFLAGTDYNATDGTDTTGQGVNSRISQTFSFVDETNDDFHLLPSDTGARNYGVDLSQDYWLPITSDVDGQFRPASAIGSGVAMDIGADEGATAIYRSIAPGKTDALASGAGNNLTISGTTATFASTVEGTNAVGVGDVIQYDSDGNDSIDAIAFISARTSGTSFTVQSRDGGNPTATTDDQNWSIFRAYTTLDNAEGGVENITNIDDDVDDFDISVSRNDGKDIYTSNEQWNIAAYANGTTADTRADVSGWTTSKQNYLKIYTPKESSEVGTSQRHNGVWDTSKYYIEASNSNGVLYVRANNVVLDGLQARNTREDSADATITFHYQTQGAKVTVGNSIIRGSSRWGLNMSDADIKETIVYNTLIYLDTTVSERFPYQSSAQNNYVYNCTFLGDYVYSYSTSVNVAKNTYGEHWYNAGHWSDSSNNAAGDTSTPGINGINNLIKTDQFESVIANSEDLHLKINSNLRDAGMDLSADADLAFSTDIDGDTRPIGSGWDIGADEFGATQKLKFRGDVKMKGTVKIR